MIAAVFVVRKSFSLPPIIPSNSFAAGRSASGNAGAIVTGARGAALCDSPSPEEYGG